MHAVSQVPEDETLLEQKVVQDGDLGGDQGRHDVVDAEPVGQNPHDHQVQHRTDRADRGAELSDLVLFDYLIHNIDRWGGGFTNVRTRGEGGPLVFLDNAGGFGAGREVRDLVCINIGTGIGAGVIIDGALHRGFRQSAGEIGYILPGLNYLNCPVTKYGALESQASGLGIARRGMQALADLGRPVTGDLSAEDVFSAARSGEDWAAAVVAETVDYLALAIANVTAIFDPEVIVLGGGVAGSADLLIDPIRSRIRGCTPFDPALVASPLGQRAAVMGAIMLVLTGTTESLVLRRLR